MRVNKYLAENTDLSRRKADAAIENGRVKINDTIAKLGDSVAQIDKVTLDDKLISASDKKTITILLNKPVGYVCSKDGQGSPTVYDLLPEPYKDLNIAGRLDKDSSGLVIMTNDGELLNELTHPSFNKEKIYTITTDKEVSIKNTEKILKGVEIGDSRTSKFKIFQKLDTKTYKVVLEEGRNRQIRRTLEALDINVVSLHREQIGQFKLGDLEPKSYRII